MNDSAQGTSQVDYEARVDFDRLRSARVAKAQAAMRESGLDALVLWKDENVRYLTSLRAITLQYRSTTQYGVILFPQGLTLDEGVLRGAGERYDLART